MINDNKHLELNIGKTCNCKCRFCMSHKNVRNFSKHNILEKKILSFHNEGYNSIGFLGGEVTIYPKIIELIDLCKRTGYEQINVVSNGIRFADYEFAEKIIKSGLDRVNISIHSHIGEVEDFLTQVPGGFNKKIKGIDNLNILRNKGILKGNLSLNIVLNKSNLKDIVKTCHFFHKEKGINDIRINFLRPNRSYENYDNIIISYSESLDYMRSLMNYSLKSGLRLKFDGVTPCIFKSIDEKNFKKLIKIFSGESYDYIVIVDESSDRSSEDESNMFKNIMNRKEKKMNSLKCKEEKCKKCIYNNFCEGIWKAYVEFYGFEEFNPILL